MFENVSDITLTDVFTVFVAALKGAEKRNSLILTPESIYQFGLQFLQFNKTLCA